MRPAWIGAEHAHTGAGLPVGDARYLHCVLHSPLALVGQLVSHEREDMVEAHSSLLVARRDDQHFAPRHRERTIEGGTRDASYQR